MSLEVGVAWFLDCDVCGGGGGEYLMRCAGAGGCGGCGGLLERARCGGL